MSSFVANLVIFCNDDMIGIIEQVMVHELQDPEHFSFHSLRFCRSA